jgi:hypothetical protein
VRKCCDIFVTQPQKNKGKRPAGRPQGRLFTTTPSLQSRLGCEGSAVQICPSRPFLKSAGYRRLPEPCLGFDPTPLGGRCGTANPLRAVHQGTEVSRQRQSRNVSWHTHNLGWLQSESPTEDELRFNAHPWRSVMWGTQSGVGFQRKNS